MPTVIRNSGKAKQIAFFGGLFVLALAVLCPYVSQIRHLHNYLSLTVWLPILSWTLLIISSGWYDDKIFQGKLIWWYSLILSFVIAGIVGWSSLRVIRFSSTYFIFGLLISYPFTILLFIEVSRIVMAAESRLRLFPQSSDCQGCGYSMIGNTSGVCPECGTNIEEPKDQT